MSRLIIIIRMKINHANTMELDGIIMPSGFLLLFILIDFIPASLF